jgi:hypothetical protein
MEFEFEKNARVDALEVVPEQFRGLYVEGDGGYVIGDTFKGIGTALDGLNRSLKAARKDAETAKKGKVDLSPLGQLLSLEGELSVDAVKAKVEELQTALSKGDQGKVNWDKMKADLEKGYQTKLGESEGRVQGMQATLERFLVDKEAIQAIAGEKGVPELLLPHIKTKVKVIQDGDDYVVRVVDAAGDPRGDGKGGFMTVGDLVKEMKSDKVFGRAFESDSGQGSGVKPGTTARQPSGQSAPKSSVDKIAARLRRMRG